MTKKLMTWVLAAGLVGVVLWRLGGDEADPKLPAIDEAVAAPESAEPLSDGSVAPALTRQPVAEAHAGESVVIEELLAEDEGAPISEIAARYPNLSAVLEFEGELLGALDLDSLDAEQLLELSSCNRKFAKFAELGLMATIPNLDGYNVDRQDARAIYAMNPSAYYCDLPPLPPRDDRFKTAVDLTDVIPDVLVESRSLAIELGSMSPVVEELKVIASRSALEAGSEFAIVRWEFQDFGEKLVGFDATGFPRSHARLSWPGSPAN